MRKSILTMVLVLCMVWTLLPADMLAAEEIPCDKQCTDTDGDGVIDHADDCAYSPMTDDTAGQPKTDDTTGQPKTEDDTAGQPKMGNEIMPLATGWSYPSSADAITWKGQGTKDAPYEIGTAQELANMAYCINTAGSAAYCDKWWKLTANINLENQAWTPIGGVSNAGAPHEKFAGVFDGGGFTISNLTVVEVESVTMYCGLFGQVGTADIHNLKISGVNFECNDTWDGRDFGSLAGYLDPSATVSGVDVSDVTVTTYADAGGLIGMVNTYPTVPGEPDTFGKIENCHVTNVYIKDKQGRGSAANFGGLISAVGTEGEFTIKDCSASGRIEVNTDTTYSALKGHAEAGGLIGYAERSLIVKDCTASVAMTSSIGLMGGFIGYCDPEQEGYQIEISDCSATGNVTSTSVDYGNVGGFAGEGYSTSFRNCSATGAVSGTWAVGGFAGSGYKSTFQNCHAKGDATGSDWRIGGFVGNGRFTKVEDCYATGNVRSANSRVGGLLGDGESAEVDRCYASGNVTNTYDPAYQGNVGGLAGYGKDIKVNNCYSTGAIDASTWIGGLIGLCGYYTNDQWYYSYAAIDNSYFAGTIKTKQPVNTSAVVFWYAEATQTNTYYNNEKLLNDTIRTDQEHAVGKKSAELATAEMAWNLNTTNGTKEHSGIWAQGADGPVFATDENKAVYRVLLDVDGEKTPCYTNADGKIALAEDPVKENYVFTGWKQENETAFTGDTVVSADCTVTAEFIPAVTESILDYSIENTTYNRQPQTINVTAKSGITGVGEITVYYTGTGATSYGKSKTAPTDAGTYSVSIEVAKGSVYASLKETVLGSYIINPCPLTWDVSGLSASKKEDGTTNAVVEGELRINGVIEGDDVAFTYAGLSGKYASAKPGKQKVTVTVAEEAMDNKNYELPLAAPEFDGTIRAKETLPAPPESTDGIQYKLEAEEGILQIPEELKANPDLDSREKIETQMKLSIKSEMSNAEEATIKVYDIELLFSTDGGVTWTVADKDNFPSKGITIMLPYPDGTNKDNFDFVITHMFTTTTAEHKAGDVETITPEKTKDGLKFVLYSLSPVAVGYTKTVQNDSPAAGNDTTGSQSPQGNINAGGARTGDNSRAEVFLGLILLSAALIAGTFWLKQRSRKR